MLLLALSGCRTFAPSNLKTSKTMKLSTGRTNVQAMLLLLLFLIINMQTVWADVLHGRVLDAETGEALEGAKVDVTEVIPDLATFHTVLHTDSLGRYHFSCSGQTRITIRADFFGYKQGTLRLVGSDSGDTIHIEDIRLQPSEELMREVLVRGQRRRFYMRGDTVVFNPDAFHLQSGDRLLDFVLKLPDVSIKDGHLLWNGEPLRIMMNGKEALSEDLLLQRLPVEAVAEAKAYERKSELEERTGVADGNQQQVLDVIIKPGFMDKWYGSAEATAYSRKNYGAEIDGMRLSDSDPFMLFGRVGDEPKATMAKTMGSWASQSGGMAVRQQMGAAGYKHVWKSDFKAKRENYWSISASANHTDSPRSSWQSTETFLTGTSSTQTNSKRSSRDHQLKTPLDLTAFINLSPKNTLFLTAHAEYAGSETSNNTELQTYENSHLINTQRYHSLGFSRGLITSAEAQLTHYTPKGALGTKVNINYSDTKAHGNSLGEYSYLHPSAVSALGGFPTESSSPSPIIDRQSYEAPHRHLTAAVQFALSHAFTKQAMFHTNWKTAYDHNFRDEQRWRADVLDTGNSFHRVDDQWLNEFRSDVNLTLRKFTLKPALALALRHERTSYNRGRLDTLACRNLLLPQPSLDITFRIRKQMTLKGSVSFAAIPSQLTDALSYTDDTNPLYIIQGNPALRTSHTLASSLRYNFLLPRGSQAFGIGVNYAKTYDPIATVLHYNSTTGAYRAQKQNVRGGNSWGASLTYDRSLTKNLQFQNTLSEQWNATFGLLTMVDEQTGISYNRQQSSHMREKLGLIFEIDHLTISSFHDFNWERYAYSDAAQNMENIYRYAAQLELRYQLKQWTFALNPTFTLNRGYLVPRMNNNLFVLNAEVCWKCLQNRGELILEGRDLLNQETDYSAAITATTHTESGEDFMHHYLSLTFRYKLEPKKK